MSNVRLSIALSTLISCVLAGWLAWYRTALERSALPTCDRLQSLPLPPAPVAPAHRQMTVLLHADASWPPVEQLAPMVAAAVADRASSAGWLRPHVQLAEPWPCPGDAQQSHSRMDEDFSTIHVVLCEQAPAAAASSSSVTVHVSAEGQLWAVLPPTVPTVQAEAAALQALSAALAATVTEVVGAADAYVDVLLVPADSSGSGSDSGDSSAAFPMAASQLPQPQLTPAEQAAAAASGLDAAGWVSSAAGRKWRRLAARDAATRSVTAAALHISSGLIHSSTPPAQHAQQDADAGSIAAAFTAHHDAVAAAVGELLRSIEPLQLVDVNVVGRDRVSVTGGQLLPSAALHVVAAGDAGLQRAADSGVVFVAPSWALGAVRGLRANAHWPFRAGDHEEPWWFPASASNNNTTTTTSTSRSKTSNGEACGAVKLSSLAGGGAAAGCECVPTAAAAAATAAAGEDSGQAHLGRDALHLLHSLQQQVQQWMHGETKEKDAVLPCALEGAAMHCSSGGVHLHLCASGTGGQRLHLLTFVPPPELQPLLVQGPYDDTLATTFDIKGFGSVYVQNDFDFGSARGSARGAAAAAAAAATGRAAVGAVRRALGLRSRPLTAITARWSNAASTSDAVFVDVDAGGEVQTLSPDAAAAAEGGQVRIQLQQHEEGQENDAASNAGAGAGLVTWWEGAALVRRWWSVHADATAATLDSLCHVAASQPHMRMPAAVAAAVAAAEEAYHRAFSSLHHHYNNNHNHTHARADVVAALQHLRRARYLAESAAAAPAMSADVHMPAVHVAAVYLPIWAPMLLPLLIAVIKAAKEARSSNSNSNSSSSSGSNTINTVTTTTTTVDTDGHKTETETDTEKETEAVREYPLRGGALLRVRPVVDADTLAVRCLYAAGQLQHITDPASLRVHLHWLRGVLLKDLASLVESYSGAGKRFWVATVSQADYAALKTASTADGSKGDTQVDREQRLRPSSAALGMSDDQEEVEWHTPAAADAAAASIKQRHPPSHTTINDDKDFEEWITSLTTLSQSAGRKPFMRPHDGVVCEQLGLPHDLQPLLDHEGRVIVATVAAVPYTAEAAQTAGAAATAQTAAVGRTAELKRMSVSPALQRCGAATALIRHVEHWCSSGSKSSPRYTRVYLTTLASMRGACELYRSAGYGIAPGTPADGVAERYYGAALRVMHFCKQLQGEEHSEKQE